MVGVCCDVFLAEGTDAIIFEPRSDTFFVEMMLARQESDFFSRDVIALTDGTTSVCSRKLQIVFVNDCLQRTNDAFVCSLWTQTVEMPPAQSCANETDTYQEGKDAHKYANDDKPKDHDPMSDCVEEGNVSRTLIT